MEICSADTGSGGAGSGSGKIKQKYEPRLKDPVNTIGGIGQSICDTADEKGVAYSS